MKISISYATSSRAFDKTMMRITKRLKPLEENIAALDIKSPAPSAILLGISDDLDEVYSKVEQNDAEFYQVIEGIKFDDDEFQLFRTVLFKLWATVEDCPMQKEDWVTINKLFEEFELQNME